MSDLIAAEARRLDALLESAGCASKRAQAYAARITLSWLLEPDRFDPPSGYISRIPEGSPDCSEECHPGELPDTSVLTLHAA